MHLGTIYDGILGDVMARLSVEDNPVRGRLASISSVAITGGLLFFGGNWLVVLPAGMDAFWLVVLALACTLFPFALCLVALRHLSAFTAQLSVNLEPIYAIVLAAIIFGEQQELSPQFYLGVAIILGVVFAQGLLAGRRQPMHAEQVGVSESRQLE